MAWFQKESHRGISFYRAGSICKEKVARDRKIALSRLVAISWFAIGNVFDLMSFGIDHDSTASLLQRDAIARGTKVENLGFVSTKPRN